MFDIMKVMACSWVVRQPCFPGPCGVRGSRERKKQTWVKFLSERSCSNCFAVAERKHCDKQANKQKKDHRNGLYLKSC